MASDILTAFCCNFQFSHFTNKDSIGSNMATAPRGCSLTLRFCVRNPILSQKPESSKTHSKCTSTLTLVSAQRVTFDRHVFVLRISSFLPRDDGYNEYKLNLFPTIVRSLIRPEYSFVYPWQNIFSNYAMFVTRL